MTRDKAEKLAANVRRYWGERGYTVRVEVIREPWVQGVNTPGYSLRTDLKNGLPRDFQKGRPR